MNHMGLFDRIKSEDTEPQKETFKFNLGDRVRDRVTGFEGIVTNQCDFITGCNIYGVDRDTGHGVAKEDFEEGRLLLREEKAVELTSVPFKFEKGIKARDTITGFEGTITVRSHPTTGINRYVIVKMNTVGSSVSDTFDENRLEVVKDAPKKEVAPVAGRTGGGPVPRMSIR